MEIASGGLQSCGYAFVDVAVECQQSSSGFCLIVCAESSNQSVNRSGGSQTAGSFDSHCISALTLLDFLDDKVKLSDGLVVANPAQHVVLGFGAQ